MSSLIENFRSIVELVSSTANLMAASVKASAAFARVNLEIDYKFWSLVLTAGLFFVARLIEIVGRAIARRGDRRRITLALYTEISINTRGLHEYSGRDEDFQIIYEWIARLDPVILTSTHHNLFMQVHAPELGGLPSSIVQRTIAFYSKLRDADAAVAEINSPQFIGISEAGRMNTVRRAFQTSRQAHQLGRKIIGELREYRRQWFFPRSAPGTVKLIVMARNIENDAIVRGARMSVRGLKICCRRLRIPSILRRIAERRRRRYLLTA